MFGRGGEGGEKLTGAQEKSVGVKAQEAEKPQVTSEARGMGDMIRGFLDKLKGGEKPEPDQLLESIAGEVDDQNRTERVGEVEGVDKKKGVESNQRQQDKIIASLLYGDNANVGKPSVEVSGQDKLRFMTKLADGDINKSQMSGLLADVGLPLGGNDTLENPVSVFDKISGNNQIKGIVSHFTKDRGLADRDNLTSRDLGKFLGENPDPSVFDAQAAGFLANIEKQNGEGKRKQYEQAMGEMRRVVYGKRQEYWDQMKLMIAEAEKMKLVKNEAKAEIGKSVSGMDEQKEIGGENVDMLPGDSDLLNKNVAENIVLNVGGQMAGLTIDGTGGYDAAVNEGGRLGGGQGESVASSPKNEGQAKDVVTQAEVIGRNEQSGIKLVHAVENGHDVIRYVPFGEGLKNTGSRRVDKPEGATSDWWENSREEEYVMGQVAKWQSGLGGEQPTW